MRLTRVMALALAGVAGLVGAADPAIAAPPRDDSSLQFRVGAFFLKGDGEFWDDSEDAFTFEPGDLNGPTFGISWVRSVTNHIEFGLNADYSEGSELVAYRDFVDEDDFEILHDVTLRRFPVTMDIRFLPGGRYSVRGSRGQYQVRRPVPYVGVGAGLNFWRYEETGDFLDFDFDPPDIFGETFEESGTALETHVLAGLEVPVGPAWNLMVEGRYSWSDDEFEEDFEGLGELDMTGASVSVGASVRF